MTTFAYRSSSGPGTITAATAAEARAELRARGVRLRSIRAVADSGASVAERRPARRPETAAAAPSANRPAAPARPRARGKGRRAGYFAARQRLRPTRFARELATLLEVGTPALEAIELMARQRTGHAAAVLDHLADRLRTGTPLAEAMRSATQPGGLLGRPRPVFDELDAALVEVGERSGRLEAVLDRLADFREQAENLRAGVGSAMLYPLVVLVFATLATLFLMAFVVPRIVGPLAASGRELPWLTEVVQAFSLFLRDWGLMVVLASVLPLVAAGRWLRSPRGRDRLGRTLIRLPLLGELARKQAIAHACVVLSTLLRSGIDFGQACRITARNTPQPVIRDALHHAYDAIAAGSDVAHAVEETGQFPALVVRAFGVGQRSGRMEQTLERVAISYERDVARSMQRVVGLIEPVLIVVIVVLVGAIAFATFLPILELSNDL